MKYLLDVNALVALGFLTTNFITELRPGSKHSNSAAGDLLPRCSVYINCESAIRRHEGLYETPDPS